MCFSAEASFTGAAVIGMIGVVTYKTNQNPRLNWLALIPFLFAIQQLSEGIIWLSFTQNIPEWLLSASKYAFLTFACIIWPTYMSFALFVPEQQRNRRRILGILTAGGFLVSAAFTYYGLIAPIHVEIHGHSLAYTGSNPNLYIPYITVAILPFFISSLNGIKWVGVLMAFSCVAAAYFYFETFASVWCFFAALISLSLYWVIKQQSEEREPTSSKT